MSVRSSRSLTRPCSRSSLTSAHESRAIRIRDQLFLDGCLAIQFRMNSSSSPRFSCTSSPLRVTEESSSSGGYVLFQDFQQANSSCYWNKPLLDAVTTLEFVGHVTPATVLVTGAGSSLETIREAWTRKILKAPYGYVIVLVGDVDGCTLRPISQSQFTPLPEAVCWVIWDLNEAGCDASFTNVLRGLRRSFPDLDLPQESLIHETLGSLIKERKIYYTGKGYSVVTPDTYRKTSLIQDGPKSLLLSNQEALVLAHGSVESYVEGNVIHKAVQTNLVDVICRGDATDRVIYGRSTSIVGDEPQRHSGRRLSRSGSTITSLSCLEYRTRNTSRTASNRTDCCSVEDYSDYGDYFTGSDVSGRIEKDKKSLFNRLFRKRSSSAKRITTTSFSAQFPPPDWRDNKVLHLHSVAVQTCAFDAVLNTEPEGVQETQYAGCSDWLESSSRLSQRTRPSSALSYSSSRSFRYSPEKLKQQQQSTAKAPRSPATSMSSSGLGRSFSPGSVRSFGKHSFSTPRPVSPAQSTDSFYSSSVGPSASRIQPNRPVDFGKDRLFVRNINGRASFDGFRNHYAQAFDPKVNFQRMAPRNYSYRIPRNASTLSQPLSMKLPPRQTPASVRKYYETDVDLSIKQNKIANDSGETSKSHSINISVMKSGNPSRQQDNGSKTLPSTRSDDDSSSFKTDEKLRSFPSLTELSINFKSITGQKILQGVQPNTSTDTLVEVNMRETEKCAANLSKLGFA